MELIKKYLIATALLGVMAPAGYIFAAAPEQNEEDTKEEFDATRYPEHAARFPHFLVSAQQATQAATANTQPVLAADSDDEDLAAALRMSLEQNAENSTTENGTKDAAAAVTTPEDVDSEDEDLKMAMRMSLEQGNSEPKKELSPLLVAIKVGNGLNGDMINLLLNARADVNARDEEGRTPLILASMNGYKHFIESITRAKADVNALDIYGKSALHYVVNAIPNPAVRYNALMNAQEDALQTVLSRSAQEIEEAEFQKALAESLKKQ